MYDVVYLDSSARRSVVATDLEPELAVEIARREARRHRAARMFAVASAYVPRTDAVLIVDSSPSPAAGRSIVP
jgi:hypothetical protein